MLCCIERQKLSKALLKAHLTKYNILCLGAAAFLNSFVPASAEANDNGRDSFLLEEIIITAQKRTQSVQDVGIAISAFSGEQLKDFGFSDSVDVARMTPNVAVSGSYAGQMSQFSIRGVTQNDFNDHVESVIAVYIDEGYVAMQQGQTFSMFDVDRVEVMKGPQGTLFGRNATGGLVHFITRRPTDNLEAYVDLTYGDYNEVRFEGAVSGLLTESVSGRLSGMYNKYEGYLDNKYPNETFVPVALEASLNSGNLPGTGDDLGGIDSSWAIRGQLDIDIDSDTTLLLSAFGGKTVASIGAYQQTPSQTVFDADGVQINTVYPDVTSPNYTCEAIGPSGCVNGTFDHDGDTTRPVPGGDFFGYIDPDGSDFTTSSDYAFDDFNKNDTYGITANLNIEYENITFTSITDYKGYEKKFGLDLEAGPVNQFFWLGVAEEETITQEFRFSGSNDVLTWVSGFYYLYIDNESANGFGALPDSAYPFPAWDQPRPVEMKTNSYSLFGQVEYTLTDEFSLTAGLRGTREEKDYKFSVIFAGPTTDGDPKAWDYTPSITDPGFEGFFRLPYKKATGENLWAGKLQLDYRPNEDLLIYAGVNQGVKAGSFNAGAANIADAEIPYEKETLVSYELGFKSTLNGGNVRFNGAAYYYDYRDYQASRWTGVANQIINADTTVWGLEADLIAAITDNLEVMIVAGYQENTVKDVPIGISVKDVETTFAPNVTAAAMAKYGFPNSVFGGDVSLQLDVSYQGEVWHNLSNFDATKLDSYSIGNVRLSWVNAEGDLRLDAFVKNVTDKVYDTVGFDLSQVCGCNLLSQGKPRWWGISLNKEF